MAGSDVAKYVFNWLQSFFIIFVVISIENCILTNLNLRSASGEIFMATGRYDDKITFYGIEK